MSSLVDMCTTEFAKLREKGQAIFSSSSPSGGTSTSTVEVEERSDATTLGAYPVHLSQALRLKHRPPSTLCSEAAVSMMVECFSP